jgi:gentisate 1,2-dioxygenase
MQYVNPATGSYPMPTMAAFIQLLPARFRGERYRSTDATVYCAIEGRGRTKVGDETFEWGPRDIFVVPSWQPVSHEAQDESVFFSFSDRAAPIVWPTIEPVQRQTKRETGDSAADDYDFRSGRL